MAVLKERSDRIERQAYSVRPTTYYCVLLNFILMRLVNKIYDTNQYLIQTDCFSEVIL